MIEVNFYKIRRVGQNAEIFGRWRFNQVLGETLTGLQGTSFCMWKLIKSKLSLIGESRVYPTDKLKPLSFGQSALCYSFISLGKNGQSWSWMVSIKEDFPVDYITTIRNKFLVFYNKVTASSSHM